MRVSKVYYRETDFVLDFDSISQDSQSISKIDQLKAVSVAKYAYTAANDTTTLFEGTTTETQLHVEFSGLAQDVSVSVSGGSLVSSGIYARAADLVLSEEAPLPDGYTRLEFIQSSGTQYINTGFSPNQNTRVLCKFQYTSTTEEQTIFLSRQSTTANGYGLFHTRTS